MPAATDISNLVSGADSAERLLLACLKTAETNGTTFSTLDKMVTTLARLTAIRKSLINLSDSPEPESPDSTDHSHSSHHSHSPENPSTTDSICEPSIREVREIPAMPLDRIAGELNRINCDLTEQLQFAQIVRSPAFRRNDQFIQSAQSAFGPNSDPPPSVQSTSSKCGPNSDPPSSVQSASSACGLDSDPSPSVQSASSACGSAGYA
ncbi:hypothetical protein LLG95_02930 [bacterium]|nr:hypothetical protein [bacterium]